MLRIKSIPVYQYFTKKDKKGFVVFGLWKFSNGQLPCTDVFVGVTGDYEYNF